MSEGSMQLIDGRLSVTTLGSVEVLADLSLQMPDGKITNTYHKVTKWDGKLPLSLFHFLMDRCPVTREEIFLAFWPNLTVKEATNVFHVTKRKISQAVGTEVTRYASGFYWLADNLELEHDARQLEIGWERLMSIDPTCLDWLELVPLCNGEYLQDVVWQGIEERRAHISRIQADVLIHSANLFKWDHPEKALEMLQRSQTLAPLRDDALLLQMQILIDAGKSEEAAQFFAAHQQKVQLILGTEVKPTQEMAELYLQSLSA